MSTVTKFITANKLFCKLCNNIDTNKVEEKNSSIESIVSELSYHEQDLMKMKQKLAKAALKLRNANEEYKK